MASIARRAGVTRRVMYLHFGSRSQVMRALFDQVAQEEGFPASVAPALEAANAMPCSMPGRDTWPITTRELWRSTKQYNAPSALMTMRPATAGGCQQGRSASAVGWW